MSPPASVLSQSVRRPFRLAHFSDPHVLHTTSRWGLLRTCIRPALTSHKRFLGLLNLVFKRGPHTFNRRLLTHGLADCQALRPSPLQTAYLSTIPTSASGELPPINGVDHIVISGDITNLATRSEFATAADLLERAGLSSGDRLSLIPGNHDIYVPDSLVDRFFHRFFGQYMSSFSIPPRSPTPMLKHEDASTVASRDLGASLTTSVAPAVSGAVPHEEAERQGLLPKGDQKDPTAGTLSGAILSGGALEHQGFPYERPLPEHGVLIVGLSSAVPQRPHYAGGLLGKGQLDRLDAILKRPEYADMFKVVMVHHPPVPRYNNPNREQRDGLLDQEELCRILRLHRVDLTLNGHMHRTYFEPLPDTPTYSDGSPQSWVGEPGSCTFNSNYGPMRARYNIYEIADGRVQRVVSRFFVTPRDAAQEEKFSEHMLDEEVLYEAPNYVCQD